MSDRVRLTFDCQEDLMTLVRAFNAARKEPDGQIAASVYSVEAVVALIIGAFVWWVLRELDQLRTDLSQFGLKLSTLGEQFIRCSSDLSHAISGQTNASNNDKAEKQAISLQIETLGRQVGGLAADVAALKAVSHHHPRGQ